MVLEKTLESPLNCKEIKPVNPKGQAGIKIAGRNINNLREAEDTTLRAESEEELKSLLRTVKEEREHVGSWIGEGNGNPLQCSCLENPRDGGA